MSEQPDLLRNSLRQIADRAEPVDLHQRSLARSKRIGRNRAIVATAAAVVGVSLFGGTLLQLAGRPGPVVPPPAASVNPPTPDNATPSSVVGLSGQLYYVDDRGERPDKLVRLTRSGPVTVLKTGGTTANVSPDGRRIAYVAGADDGETGTVVVADRDGRNPRNVLPDSLAAGYEPAWSPDSTRLLVARGTPDAAVPGTVTVDTGAFAPLAHDPRGLHYLWSANGRRLGYTTGECRLGVADADGGNPRLVPIIGEQNRQTNPENRLSCDPQSVSPDGTRMAVLVHTGDDSAGDIVRDLRANTVVDTRTGAAVALPVTGTISAVLFQPDNGMLIRSTANGRNTLTLLSASGTITASLNEPSAVKAFALLAHTPN